MLLDEDKIDDWSDTGILGEKYNSHTITSDMIHLHSWQTFLKLGYVGLVKWSLPCSVAPFYDKNFSPYLKVFLPLNISTLRNRDRRMGVKLFFRLFEYLTKKTVTLPYCVGLCSTQGTNLIQGQSVHLLFRVYKLVYNLISWHTLLHLPLFYWTTYIYVSSWAGRVELYHEKIIHLECSDSCME